MVTIKKRTALIAVALFTLTLIIAACAAGEPEVGPTVVVVTGQPGSTDGAVVSPTSAPQTTGTGGGSAVPGTGPIAPSGLDMVVDTEVTYIVDLAWLDNSDNEAGFRILRRRIDVPSDSEVVAETPANVTQILDQRVVCGSVYQYIVLAFNDSGQSESSACIQLDVPDCYEGTIPPEGQFALWGACESVEGTCLDAQGNLIDDPALCGERTDGCFCQGADLFCNDVLTEANSSQCQSPTDLDCYCSGQDYVCFDTRGAEVSRSINDEQRCGCRCVGADVFCGTTGYVETNPDACNCSCEGTTLNCPDGTVTENAAACGGG